MDATSGWQTRNAESGGHTLVAKLIPASWQKFGLEVGGRGPEPKHGRLKDGLVTTLSGVSQCKGTGVDCIEALSRYHFSAIYQAFLPGLVKNPNPGTVKPPLCNTVPRTNGGLDSGSEGEPLA